MPSLLILPGRQSHLDKQPGIDVFLSEEFMEIILESLFDNPLEYIRRFNLKQKAMELKPIKTEKDYQKALKRLEVIFDAPVNTKSWR